MRESISAALAMRTWAVVGWSPNPFRASHRVAELLERRGHRVLHVNPSAEGAYASLHDIDEPVDVVDIFRRSEQAGRHVDEAIELGARAVWLQLGVIDEDAARRARAAGLHVVMNRCPALEIRDMAA
jgi:uncharacterized protein